MSEERCEIIAISGISGAGKTTTVRALHKNLNNSSIVLYDNYQTNYEEFLREIHSLKTSNASRYIIIEDSVGITDSKNKIHPDFTIYIDTPLDIGQTRVLLRAIYNSSDKGIEEFYSSIGPQFSSTYNEKPTKLMHILVWLLKSYLERFRDQYIRDRERLKNRADLIVDGMESTKEIVSEIVSKLNSRN